MMDKLIRLPNGSSILLSMIGDVSVNTISGRGSVTLFSNVNLDDSYIRLHSYFDSIDAADKFAAQVNSDLEEYLVS